MTLLAALLFDPIIPFGAVVVLGLALAAGTVAGYLRLGTSLGRVQNGLLLAFRLAGVALVVALLLNPSELEKLPPPATKEVLLVAVDNSMSMAQNDTEHGTRADAARSLLLDAELLKADGTPASERFRFFAFGETSAPLKDPVAFVPSSPTTRVHTSVTNLLGSLGAHEHARAIFLLSDGHDFELINPAKTGFAARARQTPIFAVALGRQGKVRDVSARITSYQPYCYVKQKARITAALRLVGVELEALTIELWREGERVQTRQMQAEGPELLVQFEVVEPAVGQFEYEVRVRPVAEEIDLENNLALTYLNVIDQQIQVLFLEGEPYWDTTFFQRSLMRNDKMNVDSIVQYAEGKARIVRKKASEKEMTIPGTDEQWRRYDVVVLGRSVEKLIGAAGVQQLENFAREHGGAVIFSRGRAFNGLKTPTELEPVIWGDTPTEHVRLQASREGQSLAPFRTLAEASAATDGVPELIAARPIVEKKPLAATLAGASTATGGEPLPAMVHRRSGSGQVLSVGVDGLWRWAFNAKIEGVNTVFDRFWDQMILWLMAGRDFLPAQQFSLRASSANIPLGEKIHFRALIRDAAGTAGPIPLVIRQGGEELANTTLVAAEGGAPDKLLAEFLPSRRGKYEAMAQFPDGSKQSVRFMVIEENLEQTEVATDAEFLRRLSESSGGRLLEPHELGRLVRELDDKPAETTAQTRLVSVWDQVWLFWLVGLLFGADWFFRRRWGLT